MCEEYAHSIPLQLRKAKWYQQIANCVRRHTSSLPSNISIALVTDDEMRAAHYRRRITDVLSFLYSSAEGEILICIPQAFRQYKRFKSISLSDEIRRLAVHGMLHLAGYDHCTAKQRKIMMERAHAVLHDLCR